MKLIALLLTAAFLNVSAKGVSQTVTLVGKNLTIESVFTEVRKQTGYYFAYPEAVLTASKPVSVDARNIPLFAFLEILFKDQPLRYTVESKTINVTLIPTASSQKAAEPLKEMSSKIITPVSPVTGIVRNSQGQVLQGASIRIKGINKSVTTDAYGNFAISAVAGDVLVISYIGYSEKEYKIAASGISVSITLELSDNPLDQVQVIAYGTTTKRLNTGDVSSVTAEQIARQPVSNVLAALEGLAPGLSVSQSDGLPGGYFSVSIRGKSSINSNAPPLFLVDGVPFNTAGLTGFPGAGGQSNPLNTLNPGDIERIDILKDADATAIYGSRGANGVVLITTKKGNAGKPIVSLNAYTGITNATRLMKWLNRAQYLEMRREAFRNDNITPTINKAPDLLVWDTTREVDWQKMLLGGTAHTDDIQAVLSGGTGRTRFRASSAWHYESPLYAGRSFATKNYGYNRGAFATSLSHTTADNRFSIVLSTEYTTDKSNFHDGALGEVPLPPDAPAPFDKNGKLNWGENGVDFDNPFGTIMYSYYLGNSMMLSNVNLSYIVLPGLSIKLSGGYTKLDNSSTDSGPKSAQDPADNPYSFSRIMYNRRSSWIMEPQAEYVRRLPFGKFELLAGASWQQESANLISFNVSDYTSDIFLGTLTGAGSVTSSMTPSIYRYNAFYGRMNYNYNDKYLLNFTGRRDGSSRFGPGRQFANFGAVGAAWIFTKENWVQEHMHFLSFGKVRGSYGITGSDNVGDFQFLDTWSSYSGYSYDGGPGFNPNGLYNPDYAWETNRKLEGGLELGFLNDRLILNASYYRNRSGNQLINYKLPAQTGFVSVLQNFPATVQNTGLEIALTTKNIHTRSFQWLTSINFSINRNKLVAFPGLDSSSYASQYIIGKPVSIGKYFQSLGVDQQTGIYLFNGTDFSKNRTMAIDVAGPPRFYGGMDNRLLWKGWEIGILLQFSRSYAQSYAARMASYGAPGTMHNQPVYVLDRWQHPGDHSSIERYTTSGKAVTAFNTFGRSSDGSVVDASYVRLKNISIAYSLPAGMLKRMKMKTIRFYAQGQNLAVFTGYKGADPESRSVGNPLMKVWTGGVQFEF